MNRMLSTIIALTGGVSLFLGTANPVWHAPMLILLYPATLYLLAQHGGPKAWRIGWLAGTFGASGGLYWIAVAVHDYGYLPWFVAIPCVLLLGAYVGLWGGIFVWIMATLRGLGPLRRCFAAGLLWYLLEWTRGWFGTGFPWLTLSGGLAAWPELIQGVSLIGSYGLSGLLAGMACLLVEAMPMRPHDERRRVSLCPALLGFGMLVMIVGFGFWRTATWSTASNDVVDDKSVRLVLVQGNVNQDVKWDPAFQQATVDKYLDLSREALAGLPQGKADAIIWPETSMPFYFQSEPVLSRRLRDFAKDSGIPLLFGGLGFSRVGAGKATLYNRAFLLGSDGENQGYYDKEHLVPFGEFVPDFLKFALFESLLSGFGAFTPGEPRPPFRLISGPESSASSTDTFLGMLICYEAIFPEMARQRVAQGATVLLTISNDAWYNRTSAPVQHLHLSLLRAVEQGRWLARATNTGLTAFVSPTGYLQNLGNIEDGSGLFIQGHLIANVRPLSSHTLYFALHPFLPPLAFLSLALILFPLIKRVRRQKCRH